MALLSRQTLWNKAAPGEPRVADSCGPRDAGKAGFRSSVRLTVLQTVKLRLLSLFGAGAATPDRPPRNRRANTRLRRRTSAS